jgi:hypothetical protein
MGDGGAVGESHPQGAREEVCGGGGDGGGAVADWVQTRRKSEEPPAEQPRKRRPRSRAVTHRAMETSGSSSDDLWRGGDDSDDGEDNGDDNGWGAPNHLKRRVQQGGEPKHAREEPRCFLHDAHCVNTASPSSAGIRQRQSKAPSSSAAVAAAVSPLVTHDLEADEYVPAAMDVDPNVAEFPKLRKPLFSSEDSAIMLEPHANAQSHARDATPWPAETLEVPKEIARNLRDYQRAGVQWLHAKYRENLGGILGDDMGLGKTVQVVAFLAGVLKKTCKIIDRERPHCKGRCALIVVPTSVIHQWERELGIWAKFHTVVVKGASSVVGAMDKVLDGGAEIVLVGHDRFRINIEQFRTFKWHVAIFDEAHKLKGKNSQLCQAAASLLCPRRFGLTGSVITTCHAKWYRSFPRFRPTALTGRWSLAAQGRRYKTTLRSCTHC